MGETRLEKYKKYRESLNEVKAVNRTPEQERLRETKIISDSINTTSTLPLEEVLGQINEEDESVSSKMMTKKKVRVIVLIAVGVLLVAGITIFAIIAFGGK